MFTEGCKLPLVLAKGIQILPAIEGAFISYDKWICHTAQSRHMQPTYNDWGGLVSFQANCFRPSHDHVLLQNFDTCACTHKIYYNKKGEWNKKETRKCSYKFFNVLYKIDQYFQ